MEPRRRSDGPDVSKYYGFKGAWDKEVNAFVFASKEERDRYQISTYGGVRNGWREPDEPTDERPPILYGVCRCRGCQEYGGDVWHDETERMTYHAAIESNPKAEDEGPMAYAQRIAKIVEGKYQRVKSVPHVRMSRVDRDRQLAKLRGQIPKGTEVL